MNIYIILYYINSSGARPREPEPRKEKYKYNSIVYIIKFNKKNNYIINIYIIILINIKYN